jgi:hypothetical protein
MTNYQVKRNGEIKLVLPLTVRTDGTLWSVGKPSTPLLDSMAPEFVTLGKDAIVAMVKNGQYDKIPARCFAKLGMSKTGIEVVPCDDLCKQAEAEQTPAQKERSRISDIYTKANRRLNAKDDMNTSDYFRLLADADATYAKWIADYPADAAKEKAEHLIAKAEHEEDLAAGALTYDCDGSFSAEYQQVRHDEFMAKAAQYRAEASKIMEAIK